MLQPHQIEFAHDGFTLNAEFIQIRVTVSQNIVYEGDSQSSLHKLQDQLEAGDTDVAAELAEGLIVAIKFLFQNGPGT